MVRRFLSLLEREIRGLHEAAYLLAFFALLSQVLALLRDRTFAHLFGAGPILDAYFAAFRIPDLVFAFLTLFVSSFALIPLLSKRGKDEQGALIGSVLFLFGVSATGVCAVLFFAAPVIIPFLIPGFSPDGAADTLTLARIMLLQPILLGLSSIAASVVQASRRFVLFAVAPLLYNAGIIVGALFLYPLLGIAGLAWGVVGGAALHFLIQALPLTVGVGALPLHVRFDAILQTLRDVVGPSVPRAVALMGNQGLLVAFAAIGSLISVGAVSAMSFAFNLQSVPLTVIGVSYASALFPALAALAASGDKPAFVRELWASVRHVAFWLLPATMLCIVLRAHIVRVVLGSGAFSWDDTRLTAAVLALFAVSLVAQATILLFSRAYYALGRSAIPILLNLGGSVAAGVAAFALVFSVRQHPFLQFFAESLFRVGDVPGTAVLMVPLAYSAVTVLVALLFAVLFARRDGYERSTGASVGVSFAASVIGAVAAYGALQAFGPVLPTNTFLGIFIQGAAGGTVGLVAWVAILALMKSRELRDVVTLLRERAVRYLPH